MKKNNTKFFIQLKLLTIWAIVIAGMFAAWSMISPDTGLLNFGAKSVRWSVEDVINASENGEVIDGEIQSFPYRDYRWYILRGVAKNVGRKSSLATKQKEREKSRPRSIFDVGPDTSSSAQKTVNFIAEGHMSHSRYDRLLESSDVWIEVPRPIWPMVLASLGSPILLILLTVLIFAKLRGAGKSAFTFGKSRAKMFTQDKNRVTFDDVAGCDEAKEEIAEIVEFLKNPKKFLDIGGRIPKGCLMCGAPGTGKTLLAKAVAGEAKVPFFSMSGSDFVELFVGVGASRVRDLFEQGRKNAPCILFIDEIDAVGRRRGAGWGGRNDEQEQTLNSLLVEMDGFDGREGVILMGATNRPDVLDPALMRPGRFDRQVVISLPDIRGREEILKVHAKKIKLDDSVSLSDVACNTSGFSGADLENLLNESALLAARRDKKSVSRYEIDEARDKISYGRERKKLMDDRDKRTTAYHEAGHAIVQAIVDDGNLPVHKVTIIPRGRALGLTMLKPTKDILTDTKKNLKAQICCSMGGYVAEELVFFEVTNGATSDIQSATKIARHMVCDWGMSKLGPVSFNSDDDDCQFGRDSRKYSEKTAQNIDGEISAIVDEEYRRAKDILTSKRDVLDKLADALLKYETLDGVYVYDIVKNGDFTLEITQPDKKSDGAITDNNDSKAEHDEKKDDSDDGSNDHDGGAIGEAIQISNPATDPVPSEG